MDREKIIAKLEKEVKRTYTIKTTTVLNGTKVSEEITVNREPSVRIPIEMADKILALLKEQDNCENCAIAIEDRQPIVLCRDCKHYDSFSQECRNGIDGIMTPNFYCGNAEHKEGGEGE